MHANDESEQYNIDETDLTKYDRTSLRKTIYDNVKIGECASSSKKEELSCDTNYDTYS